MAKEEILKIAPGISIVSKGIILDAGEKVTAENFANEKVFESLKKSKQVVTEAEFLELQKKLLNPDSDSKKKDDNGDQDVSAGKEVDIIIAKNRNGPIGEVKLMFLPAYTRFEPISKEHQ